MARVFSEVACLLRNIRSATKLTITNFTGQPSTHHARRFRPEVAEARTDWAPTPEGPYAKLLPARAASPTADPLIGAYSKKATLGRAASPRTRFNVVAEHPQVLKPPHKWLSGVALSLRHLEAPKTGFSPLGTLPSAEPNLMR